MANKLYEETHIQNIANAIREKTGKTDAIMVSQMASEIGGITTGGESGGSLFEASAQGYIPIYMIGNAISDMTVEFETSASVYVEGE